jgi:hypothetical protein
MSISTRNPPWRLRNAMVRQARKRLLPHERRRFKPAPLKVMALKRPAVASPAGVYLLNVVS